MVLGGEMEHGQAQVFSSLEPGADAAAAALADGLAAGEPPGVLPSGSGGCAGSGGDLRRLPREESAR